MILSIVPVFDSPHHMRIEVIDSDPNATRAVVQTITIPRVERVVVFPDPSDSIGMNVVIPTTDRAPQNARPDIAGRYMALHQATKSNVTGVVTPESSNPPHYPSDRR